MTRLSLLPAVWLVAISAIASCSSGDDTAVDSGRVLSDGGGSSDAGTGDSGMVEDRWSLDITPHEDTDRLSMLRHGDGLLLIEHGSRPVAFHSIDSGGALRWSWSPESGDVRHFRQDPSGNLVLALSDDLGASRGNVIVFTSVDGTDGSESWSTRYDFTLGWCRGVCAVESNNREYIAGFTVSEDRVFYSGRYTGDPRHLFGYLDLATGTNEPTTTSDRVSYYRLLFDVPGPNFVGIYRTDTGTERRILMPTWQVDVTLPSAAEDQHIEHPSGLLSFLAASTELELIDATGVATSTATWTPPFATFEILSASEDSLVVSWSDAGMTNLAGSTISTGASDWQSSFADGACFDIDDTSIAATDPTATGFTARWLNRSDGTETARADEAVEVCELAEFGGTSVAILQLQEDTAVAHCVQDGAAPTIRVRSLGISTL